MSLRLTFRKARAKSKGKRGSYYIEGTDHRGKRVHKSLHTGDRDLAKSLFAKRVAETTSVRAEGAKGVANFANAVKVYTEREGENSNSGYLDEMLPLIGARKLCDLTQADLDELAKAMRPGVSRATLKRHVYTPFAAAYNAAVDNEPPLADARRWKTPKVSKKAVDSPSDDYIARLREAALWKGHGKKNAAMGSRRPERDVAAVLFLTLTGCRSGEAQRVTVRDIQLGTGYVLLRKTKNGKPRQVALAPALIEALSAQLAALGRRHPGCGPPDDALVFEFETRWGLPQMFARARKRAGLAHYTPHQIGRHAFATRLLHAGASLLDVQTAGGWDSARMVSDHYGHLAQEHVDKVVSGVDAASLLKSTPKVHPETKAVDGKPDNNGEKAA